MRCVRYDARLLLLVAGVTGRTMTCYTELEPDLRAGKVEFVNREVVIDESLVTARAWPDNGPWMREFVKVLRTLEHA